MSYTVCGSILKDRVIFEVNKCTERLNAAFETSFSEDLALTHPPDFCNSCYVTLTNIEEKRIKTSMTPILWDKQTSEECTSCSIYARKAKGGRPKKRKSPGRPKNVIIKEVYTTQDILNHSPSKPLPKVMEECAYHIINIKMKNSDMPNQTIQFPTKGPQPLSVTPVTIPRKEFNSVSKRQIDRRTKASKELIQVLSGNTHQSVLSQTASLVKTFSSDDRKKLMENIGTRAFIPAEHVASMKATLNIPWNQMRDISRWLKTFDVQLASEKKARILTKEWVGKGLVSELAPLTKKSQSGKHIVIDPKPWAYLYNVVGQILKHLQELKDINTLTYHPFMPDNQIKIGGDHGDDSFKMCYQICNVTHTNKKENTVVFSIFEQKDTRTNLRVCLERFKSHIDQLVKIKCEDFSFRVFMFGDYQYLCFMYGISGASGRHCCIWCLTTAEEMQVPLSERKDIVTYRTLDNIKEDHCRFVSDGKNINRAKLFNNVIDEIFFKIPLSQICCPGLHITLGIVLKIFNILEAYAISCDIDIAVKAFDNEELCGEDRGEQENLLKKKKEIDF